MSLEDAVDRLANAVGVQENVAVKEIIRQRDEAIEQRDRWKRDADFYCKRRDELFAENQRLQRQYAGLRGAFKRMKKVRVSQ